jgi:hypothetical protein
MFEKFILKKIEIWPVYLLLIVGFITFVLFGWVVQYKATGGHRGGAFGDAMLTIAKAPNDAMLILNVGLKSAMQPQRIGFSDFENLKIIDDNFRDQGVLLVSGFNLEHGISCVFLYDLENAQKLYEWVPPHGDIMKQTSYHVGENAKAMYRTQHPFLLPDGSVLFTSGEGPLVKIDRCGNLEWVIDRDFHHSIELGPDNTFFVPHVVATPQDFESITSEGHRVYPIRDDGFAEVSPEGKIIQEWSVKDILERNGYIGLLYGGGPFETDRIHLNDVEPIMKTDAYVQKGDLALSIRHLSTVFLYRPSTDKIIWLRTGPWLNQHDVDYQGDGVFTIFGNDSIRGPVMNKSYNGFSSIHSYDHKTGTTSIYRSFEKENIYTESQGLHTVLGNGDLFIEEQEKHILHRISDNSHRWKFVNTLNDDEIGALHWCRYLDAAPADFPFLSSPECREKL